MRAGAENSRECRRNRESRERRRRERVVDESRRRELRERVSPERERDGKVSLGKKFYNKKGCKKIRCFFFTFKKMRVLKKIKPPKSSLVETILVLFFFFFKYF
jgi:hypothetical protein